MSEFDNSKVLVTGATGFLGSRVCLALKLRKANVVRTSLSLGLDLRQRSAAIEFFQEVKPDIVLNCASFVGGIQFGYRHPAELFINNMPMIANLFEAAHLSGVKRIVNPISNCVYPQHLSVFREEEIWAGSLHESVLVYGQLRKMSLVGSWAFRQEYGLDTLNLVMSNMYGPGDHFDEVRSHALGALIRKFVRARKCDAEKVVVWGTGKPIREWLFVDDAAEAMLLGISSKPYEGPVNIGEGKGISVIALAEMIRGITDFRGRIELDPSKPDGAPHKTVDGRLGREMLGWAPKTDLRSGIERTIAWYENKVA